MLKKNFIAGAAICWCAATPVLYAQDYLKQLEETLLKRRNENSQPLPAPKAPVKAADSVKMDDPAVRPPIELSPPEPVPTYADEPIELGEQLPQPKKATSRPTDRSPADRRPTSGGTSASRVQGSTPGSTGRAARIGSTVNAAKPATNGGGYLGMTVEKVGNTGLGLEVTQVSTSSPAWKAGFRNGDHLIAVAGVALSSVDDLAIELSKSPVGAPIRFLVERDGSNLTLTAVLMDRNVANRVQGNAPGTTIDLSRSATPSNQFASQAYFGASLSDMSESFRKQFGIGAFRGVSVTEVISDSPADLAGLVPGDCIVAIGGNAVFSATEFQDVIRSAKPGDSIKLAYFRGAVQLETTVSLSRRAPDMASEWEDGVITQEMLTPDYVAALQAELDRVSGQLIEANAKVRSLEQRVKQLESQR